MKKKLLAVSVATLLAFSSAVSASASTSAIHVKIDGILRNFETKPTVIDGNTMVPMRELVEMLGAEVEWSEATQTAKIKMKTRTIELTVGETKASVNYFEVTMPTPPVIREGRILIPLRFVSEAFFYTVSWEPVTSLVTIQTPNDPYSVLDTRQIVPEERADREISFKDALKMINDRDKTLQNNADQRKILERNKKDAEEERKNYAIDEYFEGIYEPEDIAMLKKQRAIDSSLRKLEISDRMTTEQNEMLLGNSILTIRQGEVDIFALEKNIELENTNVKNLELKLSLGLESEANVKLAKRNVEISVVSLDNLKKTQAGNKNSLNKLLGVPAEEKIEIVDYDIVEMTKVLHTDLEAHIKDSLETAPTLALDELALSDAKYDYYTYDKLLRPIYHDEKPDANEDPQNVKEMKSKIDAAQRAYESAKEALEFATRNTYNSIRQMEDTMISAEIEFEKAKASYENVVTQYVAGMATLYDVKIAESQILQKEIALVKNQISYGKLVRAYEKPYLQ